MKVVFIIVTICLFLVGCNEPTQLSRDLKGVGPITQLELAPINDSLMNKGQELFKTKCTQCHTMEFKNVGPDIRILAIF